MAHRSSALLLVSAALLLAAAQAVNTDTIVLRMVERDSRDNSPIVYSESDIHITERDLQRANYETVPRAVVPTLVPNSAAVFLEEARQVRGGVQCKPGYGCIYDTGVCCAGGEVCCEYACRDTKPPTCGPTPQQMAILLAKKKMELEAKQTIAAEQEKKAHSEGGQKVQKELDTKTRQEEGMKAKRQLDEDKEKKKEREQEQGLKAETTKREEQSKQAENKEKNQQAEKKRKDEESSKSVTIIADNAEPNKGSVGIAGNRVKAADERTYLFWIRPSGVQSDWANIFYKGKDSGERNPGVFFHPNSLRMQIRSGTSLDPKFAADLPTPLKLHTWAHVAFAHTKKRFIAWVDGVKVLDKAVSGPVDNTADLYFSDPWDLPALVTVADMKYMGRLVKDSEIKEAMNARKYTEIKTNELIVRQENFQPKQGNVIAANAQIKKSSATTWMFWIMPFGVTADEAFSSILHKGAANEQRDPAIWFHPRSTRLHIRAGTRRGWNDGGDPVPQLTPFQWTHVAFTHKEGEFAVYYNGDQVLRVDMPAPTNNDGPLYAGDPWHSAASSVLSDIRYLDSALDITAIKGIVNQKRYQPYKPLEIVVAKTGFQPTQNHKIATAEKIGTGLVAYTYMFWVKPQGTVDQYSNLIHKGETDNERSPAIWFYPGTTQLHIRSATRDSWNDGCDPQQQLPMNQWTHVAVVHRHGRLEVFYNGKSKCGEYKNQPLSNDGHLYASNRFYPAAKCVMADLRVFRGAVDVQVIDKAIADNRKPAF